VILTLFSSSFINIPTIETIYKSNPSYSVYREAVDEAVIRFPLEEIIHAGGRTLVDSVERNAFGENI
jgi:hypothetical protein